MFHTQEGMSIIVRVVNYVFWHLKREEILCANKFFHAFTDFSAKKAFHFLNNLSITKLNIMIKHTNIKHKKKNH